MTQHQHTPGPWKRGKGSFADRIVTDNSRQQETVAEVWYSGHDRGTIHANGSLIAAAPDLLDACETGLHEKGLTGPDLLRHVAMFVEHSKPLIADALRNKADLEEEAISKAY